MPKNILIYSDGTGQAGGLLPDERRSNVYKLFRATRCGSDSNIDPTRQYAYYDAGLGSPADGAHIKFKWWRKIYNVLAQATGFGITQNIIDCYSAILQVWEPGDKIYLFGFSRGAYTARCVGGVLSYCGVPTEVDGQPIKRDLVTCRAIAREAVVDVYQHGSGKTEDTVKSDDKTDTNREKVDRFKQQRSELAAKFRQRYKSDSRGMSNTVPYFIGVWDTVAALGASWPRLIAFWSFAAALVWGGLTIMWKLGWVLPQTETYWSWVIGMLILLASVALVGYLSSHIRYTTQTSFNWLRTLHLRAWKLRFYDKYLNPRVSYAKHAISIDENRKDFARVEWEHKRKNDAGKAKKWFEQIWFSGVHSDVGGSYPETEARLSDQSLKWMVDKALETNFPIIIDENFLKLYPQAEGMQHDERKSGRISWKCGLRSVPSDAPLHDSVIARLKAPSVLHYDEFKPYRPEPLRKHKKAGKYFD